MKLRILFSAVLVIALVLPVITIAIGFPDVDDAHQYADAIRWASNPEEFNGAALFRGFVDGDFRPDQELTDGQFTKVVDRLFDSVDAWTRAETAALLYHGFQGIRTTTTTTTTITTTSRFPDVDDAHQYADAIRWASNPEEFNGAALFRGFPDGNFGPDQELTDGQFTKVVDRLFDSVDAWTRAETAALLYHGFQGIRPPTTTTTTTQPVVRETTPVTQRPVVRETTPVTQRPVVRETTTTTTQRQNHDPKLKVGIARVHNDESEEIGIVWVRPGWESQGWKWRLLLDDPNCDLTNGATSWQVKKGWNNEHYYEDGYYDWGKCAWHSTYDWQMEIVWDNGEKFISEPCVRRNNRWDCNYPAWNDWRSWPRYYNIPPNVSFEGTEFYSKGNGITSFDIIFTTDREKYLEITVCGIYQGVSPILLKNNRVRVHCPSEQVNTRLEISHRVVLGGEPIIISESIAIPTGTNTQLNSQKLNPQIRVVEGKCQIPSDPCLYKTVVVEVIVGNSDLARSSTATTPHYRHWKRSAIWVQWSLEFVNDRFIKGYILDINDLPSDFGGTIYLNEPGAPTHYLTYNSQMVVQPDTTEPATTESDTS